MQLPTLESGTSVAPRQRPTVLRPKGSAQLPLVAPPSPSPRNNLSSPVPPSLTQVDAPPQQVCDQFTAQFQANFPATTPTSAPGNNVQPQQLPPKLSNLSITNATTQSFDGDNSDKLFESQFPDPFSEVASSSVNDIQNEPLETIKQDSGNISPTKPIQLLIDTPKIGHRRNMSDTSAFNK